MLKKSFITFFIFTGLISAVFVCLPISSVFASTEIGTISDAYKYAWGDRCGWLNFFTPQGEVTVKDTNLSGYVWSENFGWINLSPPGSGVSNNSEGDLSGYAWGENTGWIDFSGVSIDSSGKFGGTASGDITGTISFGCEYCTVKTDWRPKSQRGGSGLPSGGGGGGAVSGLSILIENGNKYTKTPVVTLTLSGSSDYVAMAISESPSFENIAQEPYLPTIAGQMIKTFVLSALDGEKTVYAKFYTSFGQVSQVISDSIILKTKAPEIEITYIKEKYNPEEEVLIGGKTEGEIEVFLYLDDQYSSFETDASGEWVINLGKLSLGKHKIELIPRDDAGNVGKPLSAEFEISEDAPLVPEESQPEFWQWQSLFEKIKQGLKLLIPKFLRPEEIEKGPKIIAKIPVKPQMVFLRRWILLPQEPIRRFALSPLPKDISVLAKKFPKLQKTFEEVGVTKITDVGKIKSANLTLPGLTETLGLSRIEITPGKFTPPKGIPIAKLSSEIKEQIPSEIVFAKTGGELIDFSIALSIDDKGKNRQTIRTIAGQPLELVVKPEGPVKRVVGYIVFKSKKPKESSYKVPLSSFAASLMFDSPVLAEEQQEPINVEDALVLVEFEYMDAGDGVWTATVPAPVIDGEYEVITVMEYEDEKLAPKEIRLVTVVDPEGYIYEKDGDKETRISGAIVQLYWLDPETKQYELWPAGEYQQENPQTTDVRGIYSFLVPEGFYYLKVDAPGYMSYDGKPFQVTEGSGVHVNIELKTKYWWFKFGDWKTVLLTAVVLLLIYNFYRDRRRETREKNRERENIDRGMIEKEVREKIEREMRGQRAIEQDTKEQKAIEQEILAIEKAAKEIQEKAKDNEAMGAKQNVDIDRSAFKEGQTEQEGANEITGSFESENSSDKNIKT